VQGLLLVDKPKTWTSFDVVNYVRKMVAAHEDKKPKNCKVGHTGTLDPLATGLLVLLVGKEYTRKATELTKLDKTYEVTMKLGFVSTTGDAEGEITPYAGNRHSEPSLRHSERSEESIQTDPFAGAQDDSGMGVGNGIVSGTTPTPEQVLGALESLQGQIMQVPPAYSAMKIDGQRAYKLAREGKAVALEARPVTIYKNTLKKYEYPYVHFTSEVGSGTYIRSLVEDLGKILGTGAYMSDLRRTRVGQFSLDGALEVETLNAETLTAALQTL
jgi:tRNA pseudouridine55 synthase